MSDVIPPGARPLSETERAAFRRLGLSVGNWAGLAAAPFHHRPGLRPPDARRRGDGRRLEALRRELRTAAGLSDETARFWGRLSATADPATAELATRLLAWHLATDRPFGPRERALGLFAAAAGELATDAPPRAAAALVEDLRLLIDCFLPCPAFPDEAPRWTPIPAPGPDVLAAVARSGAAPVPTWPPAPVPADRIPALVRLLGDPADWWGAPYPGRRAAERGIALLSFAERERLYAEARAEWRAAHPGPDPGAADAGAALVTGVREWIDGTRKAARAAAPLAESPPAGGPQPVRRALPAARSSTAEPGADAAVELRAAATGKVLRVGDGMRVGRGEYRDVFELSDAGLAAADQFEVARDETRNVWLVRSVAGARHPTQYQGAPVGPDGAELAADGVISVGGKLELVVRFV